MMKDMHGSLEAQYGPIARFSEHTLGELIDYKNSTRRAMSSGMIVYIYETGKLGNLAMIRYVVLPMVPRKDTYETVSPVDVIHIPWNTPDTDHNLRY
jgi:hypothetical protein